MMKIEKKQLVSTIIMTSLSLSMLTACGQKGALYLPNDSKTVSASEADGKEQQGHEKDDFLVPKMNQQIQKRIEQMKNDPNDY